MNPEFVIFICIVVAVIGGLGYFLRDAIGSIKGHAVTYAMTYVKGGALVLIAMLSSFEQSFQPLTAEAASSLTWWGWAILLFKPIAAGLAVVVAFLDKSTAQTSTQPTK